VKYVSIKILKTVKY